MSDQHGSSLRPMSRQGHDSCGVGFIANILGYRSHDVLAKAIEAVINLTHRGAVAADAKTGDGAGILTQIPHKLVSKDILHWGFNPPDPDDVGVAMVFLPQANFIREQCRQLIEKTVNNFGIKIFGWRKVPVHTDVLGDQARRSCPHIEQLIVGRAGRIARSEFERTLFVIRKDIETALAEGSYADCYIASFSSRTIVYKGLLVAPQLPKFYLDLKNPDFETALALYHQRFSTNTFPDWILAQPFRMLAHNGEINTITGNELWMHARESELKNLHWVPDPSRLCPILQADGSDSAQLDNALELLVQAGRDPLQAAMMLIPEAWENHEDLPNKLRAFYEYHSCFLEPWDGPAAIAFSDGRTIAACLDRNGLRPARYIVTDDDLVIMGSEVGTVKVDDRRIVKRGRLGPGHMIVVDTDKGCLYTNDQIKGSHNKEFGRWLNEKYVRWLDEQKVSLSEWAHPPLADALDYEPSETLRLMKVFGYTTEDIQLIIRPMAQEAKDPVFSMGDDTPLAVLSKMKRSFYTYFKQRFAQVTNPPIDPIRERLVMSLRTRLGARGPLFSESPRHAHRLELNSPILTPDQFTVIRENRDIAFQTALLHVVFPVKEGPGCFPDVLLDLCDAASAAVANGKSILILDDQTRGPHEAPLPMLLALSAVHHHLIRNELRMKTSLLAKVGDAYDIHHFACLIGYGAETIYPYLSYQILQYEIDRGYLKLDLETALQRYKKAIETGLLKIMSKMGISTVTSYHGAQILEAIGLQEALVQEHFTGTPSKVGGVGLGELAQDILAQHDIAYHPSQPSLQLGGHYRYRRGEEFHGWNPDVVKAVHAYVQSGQYEDYQKFCELVNQRHPSALRDLLRPRWGEAVDIENVETVEDIRTRFTTGSISFGAISSEAHRDLAIAMNRIGAKSGSGEGGEDPVRYHPLPNGDSANSKIKQVASARFGVTTEYLMCAEELEIKMAQGSKPGEGGQLPGHKVSAEIARVRHATEGVTLISPPPHHDIYSIEDLAQLIYDLKEVNPQARVVVKLVAETGIGTIAAGVAKARADIILISGYEGGTGASPASSIKNAGLPWELGLAEVQQTLVENDLRDRVLLRTDGGMKTGLDVVIAALLGAEGFGFGTAALIAEGCIMARQCHLNTCPVGVTTQNPELRDRYIGTPERIINYFTGVATEVREILARMGVRTLDDIIGRTDLLEVTIPSDHPKAVLLDMERLLTNVDPQGKIAHRRIQPRNDGPRHSLDPQILKDAERALVGSKSVKLQYEIRNIHRTTGAQVAGVIASRYGDQGLPAGITLDLRFVGTAGQSFGAFCVSGMILELSGQANDYVAKGMTGGSIAIFPQPGSRFAPEENVIVGNTVLYGATGGELYVNGQAGERFAVRNSGTQAVVEGLGDHGCEYMTGGCVVVLGPTGRNFGAGMTGGLAYVFDPEQTFAHHLNEELVICTSLSASNEKHVRSLVQCHFERTQSPLAERLLKKWPRHVTQFRKIMPKDLAQVQKLTAAAGWTAEPAAGMPR